MPRLPVKLTTREGWHVELIRCERCHALVLRADVTAHAKTHASAEKVTDA